MDGLHKEEKTWVDMLRKEKNNFIQSTKHETETIQCSMQTTHLGTNTMVKHEFIFIQFDSSLAKTKIAVPLVTMFYFYIDFFLTNTSLNTK